MYRIIGVALVVIGAVLIVMSFNADDSLASRVSKFFTGSPTDRTIWLMIGGVAAVVVGAAATALPMRAPTR